MRSLVDAFLSLPVNGRVTMFVGMLFLLWCILARPLMKIVSIAPWLLKKIFFGLYMLIEIPVSALHSKFGSAFAEVDQGLTTGTEKICGFMDKLYEKMRKPKTTYSGQAFVLCLSISAYLLIPIAANLTEKPFTFWQKSYIEKETAVVVWMENKGWISDAVPVSALATSEDGDISSPSLQTETTQPFEPIRYGDNNERVVELQEKLAELGYYTNAIDGDFGRYTENAVKEFQEAMQLESNGICDEETWLILFTE